MSERVVYYCALCRRLFCRFPEWPHQDQHPYTNLRLRMCAGPAVVVDRPDVLAAYLLGENPAVDAMAHAEGAHQLVDKDKATFTEGHP